MKEGVMKMKTIYVGNYGKPQGIYEIELDENNGHMILKRYKETPDMAAYMIADDNNLYVSYKSINKDDDHGGFGSFSKEDLSELSHGTSHGRSYTHLCLDPNHKYIYGANYHMGTTVCFALEDGKVLEKTSVVHHEGSGPDPLKRQESPHCHYVGFTPDQKYLYTVDLGSDKIVFYKSNNGQLAEDHIYACVPGSGPRHMIFNQKGDRAYLVNELGNSVCLFSYEDGNLQCLDTLACIPETFKEFTAAAAIRLTEDEQYLLITHRGYDHLSIIQIEDDQLKLVDSIPISRNCRDMNVTNNIIITASQSDHLVETYQIKEGHIVPCDSSISIEEPVCICV